MREIKFRIWDKEYSMFDYNESPDLFISTSGEVYEKEDRTYGMTTFIEYEKADQYVVMQYTGLKDEHGKEVYEHDIVWCPRKGERFIVEWDEIGTGYLFHNVDDKKKTHGIDYYEFEDMCASLGFEVVGNIYENPDLLGGGSNG